VIRVEGICKSFGAVQAVREVTFDAAPGELLGIVGPDGAGKTTLLRLMAGLLAPDAGQAHLAAPAGRATPMRGYMPQRFGLYGECTVEENLHLLGKLYGATGEQIRQRSRAILERTRLFPFRDRRAAALSGGMKQKLALAASLLHDPELLLLDEPGTGVDPVSRREIWRILYDLHEEGKTLVLSTPYLDEAQLCTRVAFLHRGRLIALGTPGELCRTASWRILRLRSRSRLVGRALSRLEGVRNVNAFGDAYHIAVEAIGPARSRIAAALADLGLDPSLELEELSPTLEDVFVELTEGNTEERAGGAPS